MCHVPNTRPPRKRAHHTTHPHTCDQHHYDQALWPWLWQRAVVPSVHYTLLIYMHVHTNAPPQLPRFPCYCHTPCALSHHRFHTSAPDLQPTANKESPKTCSAAVAVAMRSRNRVHYAPLVLHGPVMAATATCWGKDAAVKEYPRHLLL